jgi:hypothetical protein
MSEELKPCPFCGEVPPQIVDATRIVGVWRIVHRCKVIPPFSLEGSTPESVAAKWNTRADADEITRLRAENERMQRSLKTIELLSDCPSSVQEARTALAELKGEGR